MEKYPAKREYFAEKRIPVSDINKKILTKADILSAN